MVGGRRQRSAAHEADFRRLVDEAKASWNISDVIGRHTTLKRAGRELVGICVFHKERSPSLRVNDAKGTYHCFGCGAHGDIVRFVMEKDGLEFMDALRWLGAAELPQVDPAERARAAAEDEAERQAAIAEARRIWTGATECRGSPAETYCQSRGITMTLPPSIRFGHVYAWRDDESGEIGPDLPALIGAVTNGADEIIGLQRIFLRDNGADKANMQKPKRSLGRIKGGALKLGDPTKIGYYDPLEIIICEGPEDGLSLAQEIPDKRVWVALGTALMPFIEYPPEIRRITIASQNDEAGRVAARLAATALTDKGYIVRTIFPDARFKDWNDQLRGIAR